MRRLIMIIALLSLVYPQVQDAPPPPSEPTVKFIPYDEPPEPLTPIIPHYPEIAREAGIEGQIIIQVYIDESGDVTETVVLKSIPNTGLDEAAIEAIRITKFKPAMQKDKPVGVWISIPIQFKLDLKDTQVQ
ncbi:MAG: energy transducer TonB [Candidatus Marinimicrobia bacterium]|nr:energy transducer TonB [Candidatus Neomarinimicrobiota bacterium]